MPARARKAARGSGTSTSPRQARRSLIDPDHADPDIARLDELCEEFGLPRERPTSLLALALARKHETSFHERPRRGRPVIWNLLRDMALAGDLVIVRAALKCTTRDACRQLATNPEWLKFLHREQPRANRVADASAPLWDRSKRMPKEHRRMGILLLTTPSPRPTKRDIWREFVRFALTNERQMGN